MLKVVESLRETIGPHSIAEESHWYAAYTCANHEKRVGEHLSKRSVEHFLPLYESRRHWTDRWVQLQRPLFPGYVFVRLSPGDRLGVREIPGLVNLVGFGGRPCPLPEEQITTLRQSLAREVRMHPHPYLRTGRRVRVSVGPLAGLRGILLRRKNTTRFVISLDLVMSSVTADIDLSELEPDSERATGR